MQWICEFSGIVKPEELFVAFDFSPYPRREPFYDLTVPVSLRKSVCNGLLRFDPFSIGAF